MPCPAGATCPGGTLGHAKIFPASPGKWVDSRPESKTMTVYSCFGNHCSPATDHATTCDTNNGTGCCFDGRAGLLCESCIDGYVKQNDICIPCTGAAWDKIIGRGAMKTAMTFLLCAKLIEKAATRTYTVRARRGV